MDSAIEPDYRGELCSLHVAPFYSMRCLTPRILDLAGDLLCRGQVDQCVHGGRRQA
jgi:hypothetical protein